ncbi:MAG TPA: ATP synthase F1 subunit gamma [Syntrophorhabdaceae bacterium]|nr:ATP synthase F1 subunit gamma [Syntrophorhabdaceae bacterium]
MATLRDIKRKINSINSTQSITRTMKMVSATKLRRAQDAYEKIKDYAKKMENLVGRIIIKLPKDTHPLLTEREEIKNVLIVAIASNRGLCGGFNSNIGLAVENFIAQNKDKYENIHVYVFGRKVRDYLARRKINIIKERLDVKLVGMDFSEEVASELIKFYIDGEYDKIYLIYTHFESAVKYVVRLEEFLPIMPSEEEYEGDYLYEPSREKIVNAIIPKFLSTKIYYAIVDSQTSEHAARMSAMENATKNCTEMVNTLTLIYNKRRQEGITKEMLDIVGGAEALKGT